MDPQHEVSLLSYIFLYFILWLIFSIRDISFEDNFVAEGCTQCSGQTAVKVGPGVQWFELFPLADAHVYDS